ncbi:TPA: hypothetical protein GF202_20040 [Escherichia albertii]|nr:hypothetical protein [Escherichia albertii]HAH3044896.1 hypothetical protein [Escherichia albertii]HAH3053816.1 hypothetical protein [Escherichia albertii]
MKELATRMIRSGLRGSRLAILCTRISKKWNRTTRKRNKTARMRNKTGQKCNSQSQQHNRRLKKAAILAAGLAAENVRTAGLLWVTQHIRKHSMKKIWLKKIRRKWKALRILVRRALVTLSMAIAVMKLARRQIP